MIRQDRITAEIVSPDLDGEIAIKRPNELKWDEIDAWANLRAADPLLASPYYDLEFTRAVAAVRDDVFVAVRRRNGDVIELLPFQTGGTRSINPVGARLNDVHGPLGHPKSDATLMDDLVLHGNYRSFFFHATNHPGLARSSFKFRSIDSYFLDLGDGWDAYCQWAFDHSSTVARQGQKTRALARDIGTIRFEFDIRDATILDRLIELKRAKYQRTRTFDILSVPWAREMLQQIFTRRTPRFKSILSGIWAGDQLVAVHFGMMTPTLLHYWFPVYDPKFSKYSPGTELLLRVAKKSAEIGVRKLDLGYGDDPYKLKFSNGRESLSCGAVTRNRVAFQLAHQRYRLRHKLKQIPFKPLAKSIVRTIYPDFGGWNYQ